MPLRFFALLLALSFVLGAPRPADAAATVRVIETWPVGDRVVLPRNRNFQVRLAYTSDEPVGIWIATYFRGERVRAGSSPSPRYSGSGETIAWFFLHDPGVEVDEIRIKAGDGRLDTTPVVATLRVHVVSGEATSGSDAPPSWVTELGERARAAMKEQSDAAADEPTSIKALLLFAGLMLALPSAPFLGFLAPILAYRRWQGGWRIAAAVPGIMMAFVVLRIAVGVALDRTSHNLWPFETLMAGAVSVGAIALLVMLRKLTGAERIA